MNSFEKIVKIVESNKYLPFISIFAICFILYMNSISNSYNLDDELVTINHRNTSRGLSAISDIFSQYYYEDAMGYKYEYRPIAHLSFALEHELFGESPHTSHFINILLYGLVSYLLFLFLSLLFPSHNRMFAWIATLLFIFHPIHTEVVASIKNRDEILALSFAILSGICFYKMLIQNKLLMLLPLTFFCVLGLLSKISIISFTIVLALSMIFISNDKFKLWLIGTLILLITSTYISFFSLDVKILLLLGSLLFLILTRELYLNFPLLRTTRFWIIKRATSLFFKVVSPIYSSIKKLFLKLTENAQFWFFEKSVLFPTLNINTSIFLISGFALIICFYTSIFLGLQNIAQIIFILLILVVLFSSSQLSYLSTTILILFAIPGLAKNEYAHEIIIALLIFLGFFLTKAERKLKIIAALLLLIPYTIIFLEADPPLEQIIIIPLLTILFVSYDYTKNHFYRNTLVALFILLNLGILSHGIAIAFDEVINTNFFIVLVIPIWYKIRTNEESIRRFIGLVIPLFIFTLILSITIPESFREIVNKKNNKVELALPSIPQNPKKPEPLFSIKENYIGLKDLAGEDRPLSFIESPINYTTPINTRIATGLDILGKYYEKLFLPFKMGFYYGYAYVVPKEMRDLNVIFWLVIFIFLSGCALYFTIKQYKILAFSLWVIIITILPVLNIISPIPGAMGDRFLFHPSIGFSILIAYPFYKAIGTKWQQTAIIIFITIISVYSYLTIARNAQWKDHLTLMRHDIKHLDKSAQAHNLLAANLMKYSFQKEYSPQANSMHKEAAFHFRRSTEIYPDFFNAWYDLGRTYMILNNTDSAFVCFIKVHDMDSTLSDATLNIAMIADQKQDYNTAIRYYERLIKFNPYVQEGYANLSYLYFRLQQPYKSIEVNRRAIAYNPNWKDPYDNIQRVEEFLRQNNVSN